MSTLENSVIFDKGELITNDYFTGNAYLKNACPRRYCLQLSDWQCYV
ncbi:hypothetical protein J73031_01686 [Listeria monocytogenes]|nr:hypothetical protein J73031_01686 [Listeria monocytogenes]RJZ48873.1 hypothetical protein DYZ61_02196 [Listeria monocytogenes]CAB3428979.1 hypothetical protein MCEBMKOH_01611 [Listeria monocytogenes]